MEFSLKLLLVFDVNEYQIQVIERDKAIKKIKARIKTNLYYQQVIGVSLHNFSLLYEAVENSKAGKRFAKLITQWDSFYSFINSKPFLQYLFPNFLKNCMK